MFLCWRSLIILGSFLIFGLVGGIECLLLLLSLIGGRWVNRALKG